MIINGKTNINKKEEEEIYEEKNWTIFCENDEKIILFL